MIPMLYWMDVARDLKSPFNCQYIYIFDRYGKLLKQLDPDGDGWNGTYNNSPMPADDYWFKIIYLEDNTQKEFTAHFALKR